MLMVPTIPTPSQTLTVQLAGQNCIINVYQLDSFGLFIDLYVNGVAITLGEVCENANRVVRYSYLGFIGDLAFFDTMGTSDPVYTGLGSQYQLIYLEASDVAALG